MKPNFSPVHLLSLAVAGILGGLTVRWVSPPPVAAAPQSADSGDRYVAVASEYMAGVSLLYVLDQINQRLTVYEARGGAKNGQKLEFIGARNISLDSLLDGFNDESEYPFEALRKEFEQKGHELPAETDH
jgi:hypothetical protein